MISSKFTERAGQQTSGRLHLLKDGELDSCKLGRSLVESRDSMSRGRREETEDMSLKPRQALAALAREVWPGGGEG